MSDCIAAFDVWIARFELEQPIYLGRWTIEHREYAVLEVRTEGGRSAGAYALTRDAVVGPPLAARACDALGCGPEDLLSAASNRSDLVHGGYSGDVSAGVRARALLDACAWDLRAQHEAVPLWMLLADHRPPTDPPTAIGVAVCGYPVVGRQHPDDLAAEVAAALDEGYRSFKVPGLGSSDEVDERLTSISALHDDLRIIVDLEADQTNVDQVLERAEAWQRHPLLWLEDPFPPGKAELVSQLVEASPTPIAIGDEWPEAAIESLLVEGSRPLLRLDFATLGGLSTSRRLAVRAGVPVAQHIYPELQRHLVHAGLAVPYLDIYRPQPPIDFADRMLGPTAATGARLEAPSAPGPCMQFDRELISEHAIWHRYGERG